jgi:hypothetical protein
MAMTYSREVLCADSRSDSSTALSTWAFDLLLNIPTSFPLIISPLNSPWGDVKKKAVLLFCPVLSQPYYHAVHLAGTVTNQQIA